MALGLGRCSAGQGDGCDVCVRQFHWPCPSITDSTPHLEPSLQAVVLLARNFLSAAEQGVGQVASGLRGAQDMGGTGESTHSCSIPAGTWFSPWDTGHRCGKQGTCRGPAQPRVQENRTAAACSQLRGRHTAKLRTSRGHQDTGRDPPGQVGALPSRGKQKSTARLLTSGQVPPRTW